MMEKGGAPWRHGHVSDDGEAVEVQLWRVGEEGMKANLVVHKNWLGVK